MKHLKSSLHDLHELFDHAVTVRHLAEPFVSFDGPRFAVEVLKFMNERDFDVVGVRRDGAVEGFVHRSDLNRGTLDEHLQRFEDRLLLHESAPLLATLDILTTSPHAFVLVLGQVAGIVTKGDLQKAPLRMWLFGLLSLLEMQLLRLIRNVHPEDSWTRFISETRLSKARDILQVRRSRNEAIDLADCLQFADKKDIVVKTARLRENFDFASEGSADRALKDMQDLRDELAHAQDIITGKWPELAQQAHAVEELLKRCEDFAA
ncbi:MAG: hypothetical protein A3G73_02785 [Rhodospirillales bacterium RIFCSPLOWO2_12_FULL_67_15]|nr:MAG: hypothetical protein A3G73_02785 [Rhodospirillales bacterium RIFCSPLOWO2_12_FULL_67_15]